MTKTSICYRYALVFTRKKRTRRPLRNHNVIMHKRRNAIEGRNDMLDQERFVFSAYAYIRLRNQSEDSP